MHANLAEKNACCTGSIRMFNMIVALKDSIC